MPFTVLSPPSNRRLPAVPPRLVGWWLGGAAIAAALLQRQTEPGWWVALVLNATLWPLLSYRLVRRASSPVEAERQHVLADSLFGGWWTAAIGFNLLPSILMLTSLSMHTVAVGGAVADLRAPPQADDKRRPPPEGVESTRERPFVDS